MSTLQARMPCPVSHLRGYRTLAAAEAAARILRVEGFRVGVSYDSSESYDQWIVSVSNKVKK